MKTKHISGPWIVQHIPASATEAINQYPEHWNVLEKAEMSDGPFTYNRLIARIDGTAPYMTPEQREANARLIAAAPQLLEALLAVKARLDRNGMSGRQLPEYSLIEAAINAA